MKKLILGIAISALSLHLPGQISGNINHDNPVIIHQNYLNTGQPNPKEFLVTVKGLANVKADSYLAIFSVTQVGNDQQEANRLINARISKSLETIKLKRGVETYVDMISFVPQYEYEVQRKIFSKDTYNEVPAGFEIRKNIHIKFTDPSMMDDFIDILSKNEIYDLVRVDYYAANLETIKKELASKARLLALERMKNYDSLTGKSTAEDEKSVTDGYRVLLPVEMYKSYQASKGATLDLRKSANVNQEVKSTTLYYQPVLSKEFDFVVNPIIMEPVIQVMYEVKVAVYKKEKSSVKSDKEYFVISTAGEIKNLNIKP